MATKTKNFFDWYKEQSLIVQIGIPVGAYFGGRYLIRKFRAAEQAGQYTNLVNTESQVYTGTQMAATYPLSQYSAFAQQLFVAMDGIGTDTFAIVAIFQKMRTNGDVIELIKAYGKRPLSFGLWSYDLTLPEALKSELDTTWIAAVNKVLQDKNIAYRF